MSIYFENFEAKPLSQILWKRRHNLLFNDFQNYELGLFDCFSLEHLDIVDDFEFIDS